MEQTLRGSWRYVGVLNDIVERTGKEFISQFTWIMRVEDYVDGSHVLECNKDIQLTGKEFLVLASKDIQYIDATFHACSKNKPVFVLKVIDSAEWVVESEDEEILAFFSTCFRKKRAR